LGLDSILGGSIEGLDTEMLLDPLEEQFSFQQEIAMKTFQAADPKGGGLALPSRSIFY
jgi:hypothetical protein